MKTVNRFGFLFVSALFLGMVSCSKTDTDKSPLYTENDANKLAVQTVTTNVGTGLNSVFGSTITDSAGATTLARTFTHGVRFFEGERGSVFIETLNGYNISYPANPSLEGTSTISQTDAYGKPIVVEMIDMVRHTGFGFLEYAWEDPITLSIETKLTFVKAIPSMGWYAGSGFFLKQNPDLLTSDQVNDYVVVQAVDAMAYGLGYVMSGYTDSLQQVDFMRDFLEHIRFFDDLSGYYYVIDFSGYNVVQPPNPAIQGTYEWDIQDSHGNYLVQGLIATAQEGGGFYEYYWINYQTGVEELKRAYVKQITGFDYLIGSGIYSGKAYN
ncbi:MAG: cache domain-containing protein [Bacteroidetes bacterium]|nr:cache domain-containing protein [Bacteroidota bacterium]